MKRAVAMAGIAALAAASLTGCSIAVEAPVGLAYGAYGAVSIVSETKIVSVHRSEEATEAAVVHMPIVLDPDDRDRDKNRLPALLTVFHGVWREEGKAKSKKSPGLAGPDLPALLGTVLAIRSEGDNLREYGFMQTWLLSVFGMEQRGESRQVAFLQIPLLAAVTRFEQSWSAYSYREDDERKTIGLLWLLGFTTEK